MITTFAKILGFILVLVGALGFIPSISPNHLLLGIFQVDTIHNLIHIISGCVLFSFGLSDQWETVRRVLLLFAAIYGLITISGFFTPTVLGMHLNMADNWLHLAITLITLLVALPERYSPTSRWH